MDLNIGPIALRLYSGKNWTYAEAAWVTNRNGGKARRETAINAGFKSEHAIDMLGRDNPADKFVCPDTGKEYFGKIVSTPTGVYAVSAADVYTKAIYQEAVKKGLHQAEAATANVEPVDVTATAEAAAA